MLFDLRHASRSFLKSPGFTIVAVLTLALGVGATAAIFSVVNTVLLRPLPYTAPQYLYRIYTEFPSFPNGGLRRFQASAPEYLDLKRGANSWESIDGWITNGVNVAGGYGLARVTASSVTGGLMRSLGIAPEIGRSIVPQDDQPGAQQVAVLSQSLWNSVFAGNRGVVGRDILLNGKKYTVVGVMPNHFIFPLGEPDATDVWIPLQIDSTNPGSRSMHNLNLLGRLKPGITQRQAQAELDSLVRHDSESTSEHHFDPLNHTVVAYGLHDEIVRGIRPALGMLSGAVVFLLLIACVNVANLLLARAEGRQREAAIQSALGASVGRLALQFITEGLLLSLVGVSVGVLLAYAGLKLIKTVSLGSIPLSSEIGIDGHVILFSISLCVITGLIFALAPLRHVVKRGLQGVLKSSAVSATGSAETQRFRQVLVTGQLALALILLMGTGLMLRAFWNLQEVNGGFDPSSVSTLFVALPDSESGQSAREFWDRLEYRLNQLPGIESAALTTALPPLQVPSHIDTEVEGFAPTEDGPAQNVEFYHIVNKEYFKALHIRLLSGRLFDDRDAPGAALAVVVNQTMARTFWGSGSPIGRRMRPSGVQSWYTVIGVVDDVKNGGLESPTGTEVYMPYTQIPADSDFLKFAYIAIRSPSPLATVATAVSHIVNDIDPSLPVARVQTMTDVLTAAQARPRFLTVLLTLFAGVALALAAVGVYGVVSYSVTQRTREFGLRMALGSQRGDLLWLVLRQGVTLISGGIVFGLAGAFALTRFLSGMLFGVTPTDPITFISVSALLGSIAVFAIYIPAWNATKADPMIALRAE